MRANRFDSYNFIPDEEAEKYKDGDKVDYFVNRLWVWFTTRSAAGLELIDRIIKAKAKYEGSTPPQSEIA